MMQYKMIISPLMLMIILVISVNLFAQGKKSMEVGDIDWVLKDNLDEGEATWGWGESTAWNDGYFEGIFSIKGIYLGCKDWQDEGGSTWPFKISGNALYEADEALEVMAVPDAAGHRINRYYRYQPPAITVDEELISGRYPVDDADHVDPNRLPGNADGLIESHVNTDMGVSIRHRAIGFSQQNHDKYLIREYIITNTGNTDLDPEIELPNNFIDDLYFLRILRATEILKPWYSSIGIMPGEDLRISYGYPARSLNTVEDDFGGSITSSEDWRGQLLFSFFYGEQTIFASAAPNDFSNDNINQPQMTAYTDTDYFPTATNGRQMADGERAELYQLMSEGAVNLPGYDQPQQPGSKTGNHSIPLDQRGFAHPSQMESYGWTANVLYSIGPYDLNINDSIKIVTAELYGNISGKKRYEVGIAWSKNQVTWQGSDILPQPYIDNPGLTASTDGKSEAANRSKDNWVYTGFDSMITVARAAKWSYENNYNVPAPPPAPDITVESNPGFIGISWSDNAESYPTFSGYRVYRALGSWYPNVSENQEILIGTWDKVFECGGNSGNLVVNSWQDDTAKRAQAYYYAVTAFDDGSKTNFKGENEVFESNPILNQTTKAAFKLFTPGETLDDIVVVPNPFNLSAGNQNFPGEPNKIMFYGLPLKCTIRIFTEAGDLVKVIEHEGSGDHPWGDIEQEYLATEVGQIVVSGLYIAHIQTPEGESTLRKFIVVR